MKYFTSPSKNLQYSTQYRLGYNILPINNSTGIKSKCSPEDIKVVVEFGFFTNNFTAYDTSGYRIICSNFKSDLNARQQRSIHFVFMTTKNFEFEYAKIVETSYNDVNNGVLQFRSALIYFFGFSRSGM